MTGFAIGMLAAALWFGVMVAVWYLFKTAPGHPFRSIAKFRWVGRSIGQQIAPSSSDQPEAIEMPLSGKPPTEAMDVIDLTDFQPVADEHVEADPEPIDLTSETLEIEELLGAVTAETKPRKPRPPRAQARGPVKVGRTTYVLVDDEGRPLV